METRERPILFDGEMVRALLAGRKSQTRRPIIPQPIVKLGYLQSTDNYWMARAAKRNLLMVRMADDFVELSPYTVGDRLYVRETWRIMSMPEDPIQFQYRADMGIEEEQDYDYCGWSWERYERWYNRQAQRLDEDCKKAGLSEKDENEYGGDEWAIETCPARWQPAIHMPKFAARIWLEVTAVRAEQVQEITPQDVLQEGVPLGALYGQPDFNEVNAGGPTAVAARYPLLLEISFAVYWDNLYAKKGYGWDSDPWVFAYEFKRLEERSECQ